MEKFNKIGCLLGCVSALSSVNSSAADIIIEGGLEFKNPSLELVGNNLSEVYVSKITQARIKIVNNDSDLCKFTFNKEQYQNALNSGIIPCYIQPINLPAGISFDDQEGVFTGSFDTEGDVNLNVSIMSLSNEGNSIELQRISKTFKVKPATPPEIHEVFIGDKSIKNSAFFASKTGTSSIVKIFVAPQNYKQQIKDLEGNDKCIIESGTDQCTASLSELNFSSSTKGTALIGLYVISDNGSLKSNPTNLQISWDFSPPNIQSVVYKSKAGVIQSYGSSNLNTENLQPETLAIQVETPFKFEGMEYGVDLSKSIFTLVSINSSNKSKPINISPKNVKSNKENNVLTFDLSNIDDGTYQLETTISDKYGNKTNEKIKDFQIIIDKKAPTVNIFKGTLKEGEFSLLFSSDASFKIINPQKGDVISEVFVNNKKATIIKTGSNEYHAILKENTTSEKFNFLVKTIDINGNVSEQKFEAPKISSLLKLELPKKLISRTIETQIKIDVDRKICTIKNQENANSYVANQKKANCLITPVSLPEGLNFDYNNGRPLVTGVFASSGKKNLELMLNAVSKYGETSVISKSQIDLTVEPPQNPTIEFVSTLPKFKNRYIVSPIAKEIGRFLIVGQGPYNITVTSNKDSRENQSIDALDEKILNKRALKLLPSEKASLWSKELVTLKVSYLKDPSLFSKIDVPITYAPTQKDFLIQSKTSIKKPLIGNPIEIIVNAGKRDGSSNTGWKFNKENFGDWRVCLASVSKDGKHQKITESLPLTDSVKFILPEDFSHKKQKIIPVADLVSQLEGYSQTMKGSPLNLSFYEGGEIKGSINYYKKSISNTEYQLTLNINTDVPSLKNSIKSIEWFMKSSGDWVSLGDKYSAKLIKYNVPKDQNILFKAKIKNKYSDKIFETLPVSISSMPQLDFDIYGPSNVFINDKIRYEAFPKGEGQNAANYNYSYSLDNGETWIKLNSNYLELEPKALGKIKLILRAINKKASKEDKSAYSTQEKIIYIRSIKTPSMILRGPSKMESGKEYTIKIEPRLPYSSMEKEVEGVIEFPSGEKKHFTGESSITYIPDDNSIINKKITIKTSIWVKGLKEKTLKSYKTFFRGYSYVWPTFSGKVVQTIKTVPTTARINLFPPLSRVSYLDGLDVSWSIPNVSENDLYIKRKGVGFVEVSMLSPGKYPLEAHIKDARGNSTKLHFDLEAKDGIPFELEFKKRLPKEMRAPADIYILAKPFGGGRGDRVVSYQWYLNGKLIGNNKSNYLRLKDLDAGEHKIKLIIQSKYGLKTEHEETIVINENALPECNPEYKIQGNFIKFTSNCEDKDGRISHYEWSYNGRKIGVSKNLSYLVKLDKKIPVFVLSATDDSGGKVTYTIDNISMPVINDTTEKANEQNTTKVNENE